MSVSVDVRGNASPTGVESTSPGHYYWQVSGLYLPTVSKMESGLPDVSGTPVASEGRMSLSGLPSNASWGL